MSWPAYFSYLAFAVVLVLVPGADFAVIVKNTLTGAGRRGRWSAAGVASSNAVQGLAAITGLGAVIVHYQPLFQTLRWMGIAYLGYLAIQAFRSARAGRYPDPDLPRGPGPADGPGGEAGGGPGGEAGGGPGGEAGGGPGRGAQARAGWRQGFLSNITNPKVLVFYLAVLPQFVGASTSLVVLVVFGLSHAVLSLMYLLLVVAGLGRVRRVLLHRTVRRALDAATGTVLLGLGARLAAEQA